MNRFWTEEKVSTMKRLWGRVSLEDIRVATGAGSQKAVTAKAYELGLKGGAVKPTRKSAGASRETAVAVEAGLAVVSRKGGIAEPKGISQGKSAVLPKASLKPFRAPAGAALIAASDLKSSHCQWPFGDRPPFRYCGKAPEEGSPYCANHRRVGTRPATAAEKRLVAGDGRKPKRGNHGART